MYSKNRKIKSIDTIYKMDIVYYCKFCVFYTKTKSNMKQHLTSKKHIKLSNADTNFENYNMINYRCLCCDKLFNTKSNVTRHIKCLHTIKKDNLDDENKMNDISVTDKEGDNIDVIIDFAMRHENKEDGAKLIKAYVGDIRKLEGTIKDIYKDEVEYHKKLTNNAGNIVDKTISAFTCAVKNYKDAPKLKYLDSETAKNLLCQEKINGKITKMDNNKTAEYIAKLSEHDSLPKHLSNTLAEQYKTEDPKDQSIWTTDASRMKMIVKMSDGWIRDSNGKIINEHMIVPLLNEVIKIIDQYNTSNASNIDKMKPEQVMKYAEVAMKILDIKSDISSEKINKDILKHLIPEFIMKYKLM